MSADQQSYLLHVSLSRQVEKTQHVHLKTQHFPLNILNVIQYLGT